MREIKFEAWDKKEKKMLSSADWLAIELSGAIDIVTPYYTYFRAEEDRYILRQYTGLKDKNGKEIHEGDIIEHCGERYIVPSFIPLNRMYEAENVKSHYDGSDDWMSMSDVDWEIIGNIYENPEFLEA